jgi:hypothetical protein
VLNFSYFEKEFGGYLPDRLPDPRRNGQNGLGKGRGLPDS